MTISEARDKCKNLIAKVPKDALVISILVLASSLSFGLGYLAGLDVCEANNSTRDVSILSVTSAEGKFVASRSGTKYYLPSCFGADRISEENKVWFISASDAAAAGYSPAANCKGI
jgi:hypothetical protein